MSRARILVVDDEPLIDELFVTYFVERGFEVDTATTASEGLEKASYGTYDIIFLDIRMPVLSGVEALDDFKLYQPGAKIVIMTGYWDQTGYLREKAEQTGIFTLIEKPFDMEDILQLVEEALAS